jgi:PKD repeat protein
VDITLLYSSFKHLAMKRLLYSFLSLIFLTITVQAQRTIVQAEYFFDVDPGVGNGTSISITSGDSLIKTFTLPTTGLASGSHYLAIRAKDQHGLWSNYLEKWVYVYNTSTLLVSKDAPDLVTAEYFWDVDPGFGNGIAISGMSGDSTIKNFSLPVTGKNPGLHVVGFRAKNAAGLWGNPLEQFVYIIDTSSLFQAKNPAKLISGEYFFDNDPGPGNGYPITFTLQDSLVWNDTIAMDTLSPGLHTLGIRVKGLNGLWGHAQMDTLRIASCSFPGVAFTATDVCVGDTVFISNQTSGADAGIKYEWDVTGDGLYDFTALGDTFFVSQNAGAYSIKLRATNSSNLTFSCPDSTTQVIHVNAYPPTPGIYALGPTTFCNGSSVGLQAFGASNVSYQWYKDGQALLNDTNQQVTVNSSGQYTVETTNAAGCASTSNAQMVTATPSLSANFSIDSVACALDTISISYVGNASASASYQWNFGNATVISGSGQGPYDVVFNTPGFNSVALEVNENGCASPVFNDSLFIQNFTASVSSFTQSICQGDSVTIYANGNNSFNYQWYENGQAIAGATSSQYLTYTSGDYSVFVNDPASGCAAFSAPLNITVNTSNFNLGFTANSTNLSQPPFDVTFSNTTPNLGSYNFQWELGDGNTSNFFNPIHTYLYNGLYTVTLYAENANTGCRDTLIQTDYISCTGGIPNPCQVVAAISPAGPATICNGDSVLLTASSGAGYSYQWVYNNMLIQGADSIAFWAKQAGNYRVVVTDSICSQTSPAFVLIHYPSIPPVIQSFGNIQPCTTDSLNLSLLVSYNSYNWSTGDTTSDIWVMQTGYYQVDVTDNYGCHMLSQPFVVNNSFLNPPDICIVGVDSANHNRIIWERQSSALIDSFYVYREGFIAGQYDKIGAIPFSQTSIFVDTNSNPAVQAYRYKLAAVDTCGGVTLLSDFHKTIHLTINAGLNGSWNLIWDGYQGFPFGTYRIYRGTTASNMSLLTQLPSTATSYTDLNPPSGTVFYQIEVIKNNGCYPDTIYSKANTNYNTSRSNTANNGGITPIFLQAQFNADVVSGQWPIQVSFTDVSTGLPDSWLWEFGDGNTSNLQNPKHTYNNTGVYTVKLKVCNGSTCDTITKAGYINVLPNGQVEIGVSLGAMLYPNPNDGTFTLELQSQQLKEARLMIFNGMGQLILQDVMQVNGNTRRKFSLQQHPKGVYFVQVATQKGIVYREKVIVQ